MGRSLVLGLALLAASCASPYSKETDRFDPELSNLLEDHLRKGPGTIVDFAKLMPFQWDRMCVFGPYSNREAIEDRLGFPWNEWNDYRPGQLDSDAITLVVFVREQQVVRWFFHPTAKGDLELLGGKEYLPNQAKFEVRGTNTRRWLTSADH
jgi:hypothetical protein